MDERIQSLLDYTREKYGLWDYYLERYSFDRNVTIFNETVYTLTMEWFPNHITNQENEDENPEGTAVITMDVKSRRIESVIFVMGQTFAKNGITFSSKLDIIKWIEQETGLTYGQQFKLSKEAEGAIHFNECIDGVDVSPSGSIEVNWNHHGDLTLFTVHGHFPSHEIIKVEPYTLSFEKIEDIAREQLKMLEFPDFEKQQLVPAYAVEEIYVRNDLTSTIPFEVIVDGQGYLKIDETLYWDESLSTPFDRKEIIWRDEITAEQAFLCELSPDSLPITKAEQEKCIVAVRDFLRSEYPDDSGIWVLKSLHRESGYIHAILRTNQQNKRVFQRKLTIMIRVNSLQVANYIDNQMMLEMFDEFKASGEILISREEAYSKLKEKYDLKPVYVYDFDQKQYVLCGKIDCQFAVHASTGEILPLDEL